MQQIPTPPFDRDSALAKVQAAADACNTRDSETVVATCSPDSVWRQREDLFQGRAAILFFLQRKWAIELHFRVEKELRGFSDKRISVRFEYEWQHAHTGQWYRSHGNEHWEFNSDGYMTHRDMSANDISISRDERRIGM